MLSQDAIWMWANGNESESFVSTFFFVLSLFPVGEHVHAATLSRLSHEEMNASVRGAKDEQDG